MSKFLPLVLLTVVGTTLPLRAAPGLIISLDNVADRIRAQNPQLAAARLRIQEAAGHVKQSGLLPNPELESSTEVNSPLREGRLQVEISQRFPLTDRLQLEKEISLTELRSSEAEVREVERQLIHQARTAVVKWLALREHSDLFIEQTRNARQLADSLSGAAATGEGSALAAGQAKLATASLAIETRRLNATRAELAGELKFLLGIPPSEPLNVSGRLPAPALPETPAKVSQRPDLQAAKLATAAAAQEVQLARAKRYDDVEAGIFAAAQRSEDAPDGMDNEAIVGIRFKIALPFWNKNEGAIEKAKARHNRLHLESTALTRSIQQDAQSALAEMTEWAALIDEITQHLLPLADEQSKQAAAAYQNAEEDIQGLLRTREKRLELATARLDALREFHLARIRHASAIAQP
jgi:cobalt-zinc-cadmium efflux system outer membrane protein